MPVINLVAHFIFPHHSNNHKAKLLHASSLFAIAALFLGSHLLLQLLPKYGVKVLGYAANISIQEVIDLTNKKRTDAGLPILIYNSQLTNAAKAKGEHMLQYDYWAHVAPDGTEPWSFFTQSGYAYRYAGENLARDFSNANSAIDAWMASPSHKDNMLSSKYQEIGIAVVEGDLAGVDTTIIVQLFGTSLIDTTPEVPIAQARAEAAATPAISSQSLIEPTATLTPTPTTIIATPTAITTAISQDKSTPLNSFANSKQGISKLLIAPFSTTKAVSLVTIVALIVVMVIDAVMTRQKRISRIGGRTFAHLAFLGMLLTIILIAKAGNIL